MGKEQGAQQRGFQANLEIIYGEKEGRRVLTSYVNPDGTPAIEPSNGRFSGEVQSDPRNVLKKSEIRIYMDRKTEEAAQKDAKEKERRLRIQKNKKKKRGKNGKR